MLFPKLTSTVAIMFLAQSLVMAHVPLPPRPDILFIAVDDLNDWVSHLGGHPLAKTPNIDKLVARGVTFTNAHCAAPACNPSRAALMSGLRPWQTGVYTNEDPAEGPLRDTLTLNRHLLAEGYNVRGGGKIYHNGQSEGRTDGWTMRANVGGNTLQGEVMDHHDIHGLRWGKSNLSSRQMSDGKLTDWAISQLQTASATQPLFLAVGYVRPHMPWVVPASYYARFPLDQITLPPVKADDLADLSPAGLKMAAAEGDHAAILKSEKWKEAIQAYLAAISFLDDEVGRLLEGLDASPRKDKTIIVWWSDHGWHLGEKQHWRKFSLWERATRTTCAIVAPGVAKTGASSPAPIDYLSIYPTICDLAGLPIPPHARGPSLVPLLRDPTAAWAHVAVTSHGRGNHAVRDAHWRYIHYADGSEELYDHRNDPHEWTNLATDPSTLSERERLRAYLPATEVTSTSGGPGGNGDGGKKKKPAKAKSKQARAPRP
jgi:arylsulfatase A-like enzyme